MFLVPCVMFPEDGRERAERAGCRGLYFGYQFDGLYVGALVGDLGDTAFKGDFVRAGLSATQGKLTVATDFEYGRSDNIFEDSSDWGEYTAFGINAEYQFKPRLIGTFGVSRMDITANTEDNGDETLISIGVKVPFGATYKRNNLTTSYRPGLAAAWAETLD